MRRQIDIAPVKTKAEIATLAEIATVVHSSQHDALESHLIPEAEVVDSVVLEAILVTDENVHSEQNYVPRDVNRISVLRHLRLTLFSPNAEDRTMGEVIQQQHNIFESNLRNEHYLSAFTNVATSPMLVTNSAMLNIGQAIHNTLVRVFG